MSDRELLEDAAKAAGIKGSYQEWYEMGSELPLVGIRTGAGGFVAWNPLTDDGDALRLAVKLRIPIGWASLDGKTDFVTALLDGGDELWEPIIPDEQAATRRAIVRAAAEIGKAMK